MKTFKQFIEDRQNEGLSVAQIKKFPNNPKVKSGFLSGLKRIFKKTTKYTTVRR